MKAPAREPWAIGQAIESWVSVAFFRRTMTSSAELPKVEEMAADDIRARLPRFDSANVEKNLRLRSALEAIAHRKNTTLTQLSIA